MYINHVANVWKEQLDKIVGYVGIVSHWLVKKSLHNFKISNMTLLSVEQF